MSVASAGSVLSIASAGSILSIQSSGSILCYRTDAAILRRHGEPWTSRRLVAHLGALAVTGAALGILGSAAARAARRWCA